MLVFEELREKNLRRCEEKFHPSVKDWGPTDWACAIAGEVGEMCNLIKKKKRGDEIDERDVGKEIADIVIYADLLATRYGFKLEDLVRDKFNEVSDRVDSDLKLEGELQLVSHSVPGQPIQLAQGYTNMARGGSLTGVIRKMDQDEIIAERMGIPLERVERAFLAGHRTAEEVSQFLYEESKTEEEPMVLRGPKISDRSHCYENIPCNECGNYSLVRCGSLVVCDSCGHRG